MAGANVTLNQYPDNCLNLAGDCCEIGFTTSVLQQSAYVAWDVKIYDTDIADAVTGSKLFVGGVMFTFGTPSAANNIIGASVAGIESGFLQNHFINKHFDHGTSGSYVWLRPKVRSWDVSATLTGLDATPSSKNISAIPTPVKAKEAHGALVTVETSGEETNYILFEATIPTEFETDAAHSSIDSGSISIKKDFGALFDAYLFPTLPTIPAVGNEVNNIPNISKKFSIQGMEIWGVPTNFYGSPDPTLGQVVHITKGKSKIGEDLAYCDKVPYVCFPKYMTCNQPLFVSQYNEGGGGGSPKFRVTLKDVDSNTLSNNEVSPTTDANTYVWTLVTRIDLYSYVGDVVEVRVQCNYGGFSGVANSVKVLHREADILVYRTSKYTYNSIFTQPLTSVEAGNATEFISKCVPCGGDMTAITREAVNSQRFEQLTFNLYNENLYNECELEELFSSPEVYWMKDEKLYFIEPSVSNSKVYERRKTTNPVFKGKLRLT